MTKEDEIFRRVFEGSLSKEEALVLLHQPDHPSVEEQTLNVDTVTSESKKHGIHNQLVGLISTILHVAPEEMEDFATFKELGVDSISAVEIVRDINQTFQLQLDAVVLYDKPTIRQLVDHIFALLPTVSSQRNGEIKPHGAVGTSSKSWNSVEVEHPDFQSMGVGIDKKDRIDKVDELREQEEQKLVEKELSGIVRHVLLLQEDELSRTMSFKEMGMDSISSVEIVRLINQNEILGVYLDSVVLYDYTTIQDLTAFIVRNRTTRHTEEQEKNDFTRHSTDINNNKEDLPALSEKTTVTEQPNSVESIAVKSKPKQLSLNPIKKKSDNQSSARNEYANTDIAIIGMSGRFPLANNLKEFWGNLVNDVDCITEPTDRWDLTQKNVTNSNFQHQSYSTMGGYLTDIDTFDPLFFNISPAEAKLMDPQQRVFLEEAWKALEDAGYSDQELSNTKCGVFVAAVQGDYAKHLAAQDVDTTAEAFTGMAPSILAARISYLLNLRGPSLAIDTACSSSLVAIHLACQSLISGESEMAIAGGVAIMTTPDLLIKTNRMEMVSPDGRCRAFDKLANGTVFSEGVGAIILKPLAKALEDRDQIYGIIKKSGINQDGKTNGITAPSSKAQADLEIEVYKSAGINPEQITYVEAHGTGTPLGDPIEVKALTEAFRTFTAKQNYCALGSVKANIGHTTMAAGVVSVMKVLLQMKYKKLLPLKHFKEENEHIQFKGTPFYINTKLQNWDVAEGLPRMASISSFGFSGTNCHMVIQEGPSGDVIR